MDTPAYIPPLFFAAGIGVISLITGIVSGWEDEKAYRGTVVRLLAMILLVLLVIAVRV